MSETSSPECLRIQQEEQLEIDRLSEFGRTMMRGIQSNRHHPGERNNDLSNEELIEVVAGMIARGIR